MDSIDPRLIQASGTPSGRDTPSSAAAATPTLTLTIPSLKALKERVRRLKESPLLEDAGVRAKKPVRPPKLKPLKEVLTKLITQIKK